MKLEDLGYNESFEQQRIAQGLHHFELGRVISEHKERYIVKTTAGEFEAEVTGNLRFSSKSREDFPAVGDWVALIPYEENFAIIHKILPRKSLISRQAVGKFGEQQVIAANVDVAFLVQSVDRDLNTNRLERYLTICHASKVTPIIVLTKVDLIDSQTLDQIRSELHKRIKQVLVLTVSNETKEGYDSLRNLIEKGQTYCLLGSSGVGKSTLLNNLAGKTIMKTNAISKSAQRGRHITSHRELVLLDGGGILIDNPGLREVGITDMDGGIESTFGQIEELAKDCKYKDCSHTNELGCRLIKALEEGEIDEKSYQNYLKIGKEKEHYEQTVSEKRKKDKDFGKMVKNMKNDLKKINAKRGH